jgi:GAF domain-containing protein
MAERDLEATLQLLAERAHSITGASGAAIALRDGDAMICRASAGAAALKAGDRLEVGSGLSGESVRLRQMLRCDDAASDPRVNRQGCSRLGIVSALVMPLMCRQQVVGVFELMSDRAHAFDERDAVAMQRLGEMIQTAIETAEASSHLLAAPRREQNASATGAAPAPLPLVAEPLAPESITLESLEASPLQIPSDVQPGVLQRGEIGLCRKCGFPISKERTLCLDCDPPPKPLSEESQRAYLRQEPALLPEHGFLATVRSVLTPKYLLALVLAALAAAGLVFSARW